MKNLVRKENGDQTQTLIRKAHTKSELQKKKFKRRINQDQNQVHQASLKDQKSLCSHLRKKKMQAKRV